MDGETERRERWPMIARVLLLMQVNMLFIAAVHHHSSLRGLFHHPTAIARASASSKAGVATTFCLTCQVVRHGGARPAIGVRVAVPSLLVACLLLLHSRRAADPCQLAVYGRAPPLA